jgi:tetratricopeptide repeat protein/methyltransferase family protein
MSGATPASGIPGDDVDPLTRIALRHGTDKWGAHFYTPVYHQLFAHLRERPVRLLEIGIGGYEFARLGGASLAMWADYFPNGRILGIDVCAKTLELDPRVSIRQGSQDDAAFLTRMSSEHGPFDIAIDDGSHVPAHVIASFNVLFPLLADGGLYVIEDVQSTFWPQFGGSVLDGGGTMQLARTMLEHLHHAEIAIVQPERPVSELVRSIRSFRAWHNVFAIEKGDNSEPSNFNFRLDNVHAARAVRTIKDELARAPTPAGYANLIDMHMRARDLREAWNLLEEALARWPGEPVVLFAAYRAARHSGNPPLAVEFLRRLAALEPDNAAVQALLRKTEAEAASGAR